MDAPDLSLWIEAQNPPALVQTVNLRSNNLSVLPRQPGSQGKVDGETTVAEDLASGRMRLRAIREAAFTMGAQTALAWRYEELLRFTKSQEGTLDRIAGFAPFVVDEYMLLPSITETRDRFDVSSDGQEMRTMRVQYILDQQPRAISQPPTWRDYLWRDYPYPEPPHPTLLPQDDEEEAVWEAGVRDGWVSGLEQAQYSWENNLNQLVRDIRGRITYRVLEALNKVQRPVMVGSVPGITLSADGTTLNAGDQVYSITVPVEFTPEADWQPLWRQVDMGEPKFQLLDQEEVQPNFRAMHSPAAGGQL